LPHRSQPHPAETIKVFPGNHYSALPWYIAL